MNYKNLLYEIRNAAMSSTADNNGEIIVPSNKHLYRVDLNTREIEGPEVLSIQSEHYAETVYFLVDRYYDSMDLAQTNCVIQYTINGESYVYAVPFYDISTYNYEEDDTPKMVIPWSISISATKRPGTVKYFIRFYLIDENSVYNDQGEKDPSNAEFSYSLSTLVSTAKVLVTLPQEDFTAEDNDFKIPERYFEFVDYVNNLVDNSTVYWIEADDML